MTIKYSFELVLCTLACLSCHGLDVRGRVTLASSGCPIPGLTIELDPVVGSSQPKVFTSTGQDGEFLLQVLDGRYLIQVFQYGSKVYQQDFTAQGSTDLRISVKAAGGGTDAKPCLSIVPPSTTAPQTKVVKNWRPTDLSYDTDAGLLILDDNRHVTRISQNEQGLSSEELFSLPLTGRPVAIASGGGKVFVTSNSTIGCTLYEWNQGSRRLTPHLTNRASGPCSGVATDGRSVVVSFGEMSELRYFSDSDLQRYKSQQVSGLSGDMNMVLASDNRNLLVGDRNGKILQLTFGEDGSRQIVNNAGQVTSLALSARYLLVSSYSGLRCYGRQDWRLLDTSACLDAAPKGVVTGVRVDNQDRAWILLRDKNSIVGPLTLK